jgi:glucose/arabinose dehydrogenase
MRPAARRRQAARAVGLRSAVALVAAAAVLAACTGGQPDPGVSSAPAAESTAATSPTPGPSATAVTSPSAGSTPALGPGPVTATAETVVEDLAAPWGLAPLPGGALLVSERDAARLVVVDPDAGTTTPVTGPGADQLRQETRPRGEGGLLGVAVDPASGDVIVYRTGPQDNAVLRGTLEGTVLGELTTLFEGIPRASNHDGGGVGFGPDGHLYVATGDAQDPGAAQDRTSLAGKILRLTPDGEPAPGNPEEGSPVWSLGHRNVQGLGWDAAGTMYAAEFGATTYDELNVIEPGGNYGWPDAEGPGGPEGTVDPVAWWPTSDASPSGLAVMPDGVYLAALRGERLWRVPFREPRGPGPDDAPALEQPQPLLDGEHGRLRAVVAHDATTLWVLTNNTDGRGSPRDGDDRLLRVRLAPE